MHARTLDTAGEEATELAGVDVISTHISGVSEFGQTVGRFSGGDRAITRLNVSTWELSVT